MTAHVFDPIVIKEASVTIDGVEYGDPIDSAVLTPTFTSPKFKGISGRQVTRVGKPEWTLALNFAQELTEGSLTHLLMTRHGEQAAVVVAPLGAGAGQPTITAQVTLTIGGALGGKIDDVPTAGATFGVDGQPVISWTAAAAG